MVIYRMRVLLCFLLFALVVFSAHGDEKSPVGEKSEESMFNGLFNPQYVLDMYRHGLRRLTQKAKTDNCRRQIEFEYMKYMRSLSEERPFPFEEIYFHTQCASASEKQEKPLLAVGMKNPPNRPNLPPHLPNTATYKDPKDISILYVLLMHDNIEFAQKLILALDEPNHTYIIHVDYKAQDIYNDMITFRKNTQLQGDLHILEDSQGRETGAWGGFSLVNSTLNAMRYAVNDGITFDYMIDISGTTYPLVNNKAIRTELSKKPGYTHMEYQNRAGRPPADMWQNFVECDGVLHRIARLTPPRGINMYTGSQWFILPYHVVHWFLNNPLPKDYIHYAKHVVVADEHYFATMFRNSPFCDEIVTKNHVFLLFDKWENQKNQNITERDERKCLYPDPNHCGRSPTILTKDYKRILQTSQHLFARKFDPANENSMELLREIDEWRADPDHRMDGATQRFMIRQKSHEDNNDTSTHMCMEGSPDNGRPVKTSVCNATLQTQWFTFGRCTGSAKRTSLMNVHESQCGMYVNVNSEESKTSEEENSNSSYDKSSISVDKDADDEEEETACQIIVSSHSLENHNMPNNNNDDHKCLDISGESHYIGAKLINWQCTGNWNQLFHYSSDCTLSAMQPNVVATVRDTPQNVTRCLTTSTYDTKTTNNENITKHNFVITSDCPEDIIIEVSEGEDSTPTSSISSPGEVISKSITQPQVEQQWEFLPRESNEWIIYDHSAQKENGNSSVENNVDIETEEEL